MSRSWLEYLRVFFHPSEHRAAPLHAATFDQMCRQDPVQAQALLRQDQRELAEELEQTYSAYQARLQKLTQRIVSLPPDRVEHEAAFLRECQDQLRIMLRRIEASTKTAQELDRELHEWSSRTENGPRHSDHPVVRTEILRSELQARHEKRELIAIPPQESPFAISRIQPMMYSVQDDESPVSETSFAKNEDVRRINPAALIAAIRLETREAERWHAVSHPDQDAIDQVRQLKMLHAELKKQDRARGIQRDRIQLAVRMQDVPVDDSSVVWHSLDAPVLLK